MSQEGKYTGGPAFPIPGKVSHYEEGTFKDEAFAGMSLRDYFAAKAMQGLMAHFGIQDQNKMADAAYRQADAMLAERDQ